MTAKVLFHNGDLIEYPNCYSLGNAYCHAEPAGWYIYLHHMQNGISQALRWNQDEVVIIELKINFKELPPKK